MYLQQPPVSMDGKPGDSVSNTEAWHLLSAARSVSGEGVGFFWFWRKGSRKKQRSIKCGIDAHKDGRTFGIDANKDVFVKVCVYFVFLNFFLTQGFSTFEP